MGFRNPNDTVYKTITLPRWQKTWLSSHRSINFSGVAQEVLDKIIMEKDPKCFEEHKGLLKQRQARRRENTIVLLEQINSQMSV